MSADPRRLRIARILVALDASPASIAAAEAAAQLAAELRGPSDVDPGAELEGIYVEDVTVARLSEYPYAPAVDPLTGQIRELASADLERAFRRQADAARAAMERAASRFRVPSRFRTVRGKVAAELIAAAEAADLVSLGRTRGLAGLRHLGSTARALLARGARSVLLLPHGGEPLPLRPPIAVVFAGDEPSFDALAAAARLIAVHAGGADRRLVVFLAAPPAGGGSLRHDAEAYLAGHLDEVPILRFHPLPDGGDALARAVRNAGARLLVLPTTAPALGDEQLTALVERTDLPVLLVR